MSIRQASTPPALGVIARFGKGEHVVDTGQQDGEPAVFVRPARQPGVPGESANREQGPLDQLEPGEFVLIASSAEHAKGIADALCGSPLPAPGVQTEALRETRWVIENRYADPPCYVRIKTYDEWSIERGRDFPKRVAEHVVQETPDWWTFDTKIEAAVQFVREQDAATVMRALEMRAPDDWVRPMEHEWPAALPAPGVREAMDNIIAVLDSRDFRGYVYDEGSERVVDEAIAVVRARLSSLPAAGKTRGTE